MNQPPWDPKAVASQWAKDAADDIWPHKTVDSLAETIQSAIDGFTEEQRREIVRLKNQIAALEKQIEGLLLMERMKK